MKTPPSPQPEMQVEAVALNLKADCSSVYPEPLCLGNRAVAFPVETDACNERLERVRAMRFDHLRFLLVDDSPDNQKLFHRILAAAGATVDIAENGRAAVECFREKGSYDLIVMDIRMPIVDGYEATRQIRALGYTKPIVALTAHATPGEEEKCRLAGCSDFKLKPIDRLSLLMAVSEAVSRSAESTTTEL